MGGGQEGVKDGAFQAEASLSCLENFQTILSQDVAQAKRLYDLMGKQLSLAAAIAGHGKPSDPEGDKTTPARVDNEGENPVQQAAKVKTIGTPMFQLCVVWFLVHMEGQAVDKDDIYQALIDLDVSVGAQSAVNTRLYQMRKVKLIDWTDNQKLAPVSLGAEAKAYREKLTGNASPIKKAALDIIVPKLQKRYPLEAH